MMICVPVTVDGSDHPAMGRADRVAIAQATPRASRAGNRCSVGARQPPRRGEGTGHARRLGSSSNTTLRCRRGSHGAGRCTRRAHGDLDPSRSRGCLRGGLSRRSARRRANPGPRSAGARAVRSALTSAGHMAPGSRRTSPCRHAPQTYEGIVSGLRLSVRVFVEPASMRVSGLTGTSSTPSSIDRLSLALEAHAF